jgi:hypothetical protein
MINEHGMAAGFVQVLRFVFRYTLASLMIVLLVIVGSTSGWASQKQIMEYYIYYQGDWAKYSGQQRYEYAFATWEEAERARQKAAVDTGGLAESFLRDTYIKEVPTGRYTTPTQDAPETSPSPQGQGQIRNQPKSGRTNKPDNSSLVGRLKGRTTAGSSSGGDGKDISSRLKGGTTAVSSSGGDGKDISSRLKGGTTPVSSSGEGGVNIVSRLKPGNASSSAAKPMDWSAKSALWIEELAHINRQLAVTRSTLLRLNESILGDRKLFAEWEKEADEGFKRSRDLAIDAVIDTCVSYLAERYETIHGLAVKLPDKPEAVIEKYRHMASLYKILVEAKAAKDLDGLAKRTGKTDAEIYEIFRDGIAQISGLVGLDKTIPGKALKYGSLAFDWIYNLEELYLVWKNVGALESNNTEYAKEIMVLSNRMRELQARQEQLVRNIEAGEPRR